MSFKKFSKKFAATMTAFGFGAAVSFSALPVPQVSAGADALGIGIGIISGVAQMSQANKQIEILNNTDEGQQILYQSFVKEYGKNDDPELNAKLDSIMKNLSKAVAVVDSSINDKPYLYFVSADKSLNAACGMGHVMMVNTGTFNHITSDDEIAAIVGHEMGHGQKDHVAKKVKKHINKATLAQVGAAAAGGSTLTNAIAVIALKQSMAHGDRVQETEADNLAWEYMLHTNYNIGACAAVQQRFVELFGSKNSSNFLNPSDHPDSDKRLANYANKLHEYSGKHVTAENGVIKINGKVFTTVAATSKMSSAERAYFVFGNLAATYHNGHSKSQATVSGNTLMLGKQPIMTVESGDEDINTLAEKLNAIK
ncbi:MAG: M48 family metallopeptidase [Selenomonadaceae bacterium]|nr:M48 family metallopeptidase [Selenomonadaceae bacterium]